MKKIKVRSVMPMNILLFVCVFLLSISCIAQEKSTYVYKTIGEKQLKLDVYTPTVSDQKARPVIIFFHGGGFIIGSRSLHKYQCTYFAQRGMVAVSADYRLLARGADPKTEVPKCIMDAKSAVRWVKQYAEKFNVDTNKVFLAGASAGGFLATAATFVKDVNEKTDDLRISVDATALVLFNPAYTPDTRYTPSMPSLVSKESPPAVLFYGDQDRFKLGGDKFFNLLRKEKIPTTLWVASGENHSFYKLEGWNEATCNMAYNFLLENEFVTGLPEPDEPRFELKRQEQ